MCNNCVKQGAYFNNACWDPLKAEALKSQMHINWMLFAVYDDDLVALVLINK